MAVVTTAIARLATSCARAPLRVSEGQFPRAAARWREGTAHLGAVTRSLAHPGGAALSEAGGVHTPELARTNRVDERLLLRGIESMKTGPEPTEVGPCSSSRTEHAVDAGTGEHVVDGVTRVAEVADGMAELVDGDVAHGTCQLGLALLEERPGWSSRLDRALEVRAAERVASVEVAGAGAAGLTCGAHVEDRAHEHDPRLLGEDATPWIEDIAIELVDHRYIGRDGLTGTDGHGHEVQLEPGSRNQRLEYCADDLAYDRRTTHQLHVVQVNRVVRHVFGLCFVWIAAMSGCGSATQPEPASRVRPLPRRAGEPGSATAEREEPPAGPRTPPIPPGTRPLFARHAPPGQDAELRQALLRVIQEGYEQWQTCYEPVLCDDTEPPSVAVELTVGPEGHVREAHASSVTRFVLEGDDIVERSGDVNTSLARCLEDFLQGLTLRWRGEEERALHYRFRPETADCSP